MSATFLVTGFEPFAEHRTNSSWAALEHLRSSWPAEVSTLRLPVDHRAAHEALRRALDELTPTAVLCTGLAKGRTFRMERRARRPPQLASEGAAPLCQGRWPWDEMREALDATHVEVIESFDAGQYVCESTYWSLLTYAGRAVPPRPSGPPQFAAFLHVPPLSDEHPVERIAAAVGSVVAARLGELESKASLPRANVPGENAPGEITEVTGARVLTP
jgi:pyrrolidone-carboxylate peptidase